MDFGLSEEQKMLKQTARDFLTAQCPSSLVKEMAENERGYSPELWRKMAELGWMGLAFPEGYGGTGSSFLDLAVLLEEMGRACLPGPFFSTVVLGGMTILELGKERQKQRLLPMIAKGDLIVTLALAEPETSYGSGEMRVKAMARGDGYVITGTKLFVPDAHIADYIICAARAADGATLFLVDAKSPGLSYSLLKTIAGDKQCEVVFNQVKVPKANVLGRAGQGWIQLQSILRKAAVAKCAEMVGGAQRVLEMTIDYVKLRVQFGQPIGAFQAIQHHCANMATDVETSKFITYQAAWRLSQGLPCQQEAAMAKAWVSEAFKRVTLLGHQCIGGVGFMEDHDLPLYSKRATGAEIAFGDADFHREVVAQELGL